MACGCWHYYNRPPQLLLKSSLRLSSSSSSSSTVFCLSSKSKDDDEIDKSEAPIKGSGTTARGRRLLRIRQDKLQREYDRLHNYPAWAK